MTSHACFSSLTPSCPHTHLAPVDPTHLTNALRTACNAAITAEPEITKWDIQMGDGDCGEAVVGICTSILRKLDAGLCEQNQGHLFPILDAVEDCVEDIGGTLGAIISIVLASFTSSLRTMAAKAGEEGLELDMDTIGKAAGEALKNLMTYTGARVGGRTVMDTLIPFCETLEKEKVLSAAVGAAEQGARKTEGMQAKFGRATYVGDKGNEAKTPMDPGAWAAAVWLKGLREGLQG